MRPSTALNQKRDAVHAAVGRYRTSNPRVFGSALHGTDIDGSDLDLLVIEDSKLPRFKRNVPYYEALEGLFPSKDVVVWTPAEIAEWSATPNHFITTAMREGQVLYER